jgi:hypothetical protein
VGAFEHVAGPGARPGGAELVYLRLPDGSTSFPRVFGQPSLDDVPFPLSALGIELPEPDEEGPTEEGPDQEGLAERRVSQPTWVHRRLAEAAQVIRSEDFVARVGSGCRYCPFRGSCPAQPTGRQVVT